ncbi:MAG: ABC transporter ATP-binding protein [Nocardioides sp.]|nr:ABC transporter ATP-binding protein [Nocardioides sp.]
MTALHVTGLTASYAAQPVLRGVDLDVAGGVTAMLGSSGCGKTTLLRVIAGFHSPDSGMVAIGGKVVAGRGRPVAPRHRGIGYVPQEGALFPHLSVADNITFGLPRRDPVRPARLAEMLELVELPRELAQRYPHELSGGQQQRVALARALAPRPTLVLLDEPFASLDAGLREETGRAVVRAVRASGAAGVLVTHDQGEALSLADQVAVMADGAFVQIGTPADVYLSPADAGVAAFVGHATLIDGTLGADGHATCALGSVQVRGQVTPGRVRLALRAEQVQPTRANGGAVGEVEDVSFFGHDATIRVRLTSGERITARTPADAIPTPGDRVDLRVVGDVLAFPGAAS